MTAVRFVESSAGIQAVVDGLPVAMAWHAGDGAWAVQHRGDLFPVLAGDREDAEEQLRALFAQPARS